MNVILIGCGGIGGWAAQCLGKTLHTDGDRLVLVDGDTIETKNIDRQLFGRKDVGINKAEAMVNKVLQAENMHLSLSHIPHYIGSLEWEKLIEEHPLPDKPFILTGVDNHPARKLALDLADQLFGQCILAGNSYEDAEAFYYHPSWKDTHLDPRVYYNDIVTNTENNPLNPPCTGEILESEPQLAIANMNAASIMMWLFWYWTQNASKLTLPQAKEERIVHVQGNAFSWNKHTMKDYELRSIA